MTADTPARTPSDAAGQTDPRQVEATRFNAAAGGGMEIDRFGQYVRFTDYAALREKLEAAVSEARKYMAEFDAKHEDMLAQKRRAEAAETALTTARAETDAAEEKLRHMQGFDCCTCGPCALHPAAHNDQ